MSAERFTVYTLAKYLAVSPSAVYAWRQKNWIPAPYRLGGRVFWDAEAIRTWEAAGFPRPEPKEQAECPHQ